jgi:hypothetical protein
MIRNNRRLSEMHRLLLTAIIAGALSAQSITPPSGSGGGGGGGLTVGTTTITGGTTGYALYNNAGVLGNEALCPAIGSPVANQFYVDSGSGCPTYSTALTTVGAIPFASAAETLGQTASLIITNAGAANETLTIYNPFATTGLTQVALNAGAAQCSGGTPLLTIATGATANSGVDCVGQYYVVTSAGNYIAQAYNGGNGGNGGLALNSAGCLTWTSTTQSYNYTSQDTKLCRTAAGVVSMGSNPLLPNVMTTIGDMIYGGTAGAATRLAGPTAATQYLLGSIGTGSAAQAPAWSTLAGLGIVQATATTTVTTYVPIATTTAGLYTPGAITASMLPGSLAVADITVAVTGATQNANTCSSATTATMTGLTTAMVVISGYSTSPSAATGWGSTGGMVFQGWPSAANTLSWIVCNQTASNITYSSIIFNVGAR